MTRNDFTERLLNIFGIVKRIKTDRIMVYILNRFGVTIERRSSKTAQFVVLSGKYRLEIPSRLHRCSDSLSSSHRKEGC